MSENVCKWIFILVFFKKVLAINLKLLIKISLLATNANCKIYFPPQLLKTLI